MIRSQSVIMVVTLLCLTTFAASAYAESAWVLWSSRGDLEALTANKMQWTMVKAYENASLCDNQLKVAVADYLKTLRGTVANQIDSISNSEDTIAIVWKPEQGARVGKITLIKYRCLPDTVDPRGPKGK